MVISNFISTITGTILGGEALRRIGSTPSFPSGLGKATQSFIGLGVVATSVKNGFKFK